MKKLSLLLLTLIVCCFTACHKDIWAELENLDQRVTKLEELCKEMNTNITSLQTIVSVLQSNDFITGIVEIKKNGEVIGYTITFGKYDPITIYHGQDGKDGQNGQNGADGKDGITPVIGVAQDTDGVYYWTLNGEWLLDDNGNKLPVSGKVGQNGTNGSNGQDGAEGKDGHEGEDGKDGADGQDGKDGITPQLKIEDGYWYISYDNGVTWTQLGKATGEDGQDGKDGTDGEDGKDGQNGADGKDGQDGDSMFQSVTQDENYVYFTLADGTVIKIAKGNGNSQSNDDFIFTITYDPNGGMGTILVDTIYYGYTTKIKACTFTMDGYLFIEWNTDKNGKGAPYQPNFNLSIDKNITLYAQWKDNPYLGTENGFNWVDLGLSVKWSTYNVGATKPEEYGDYFAWGEVEPKTTYGITTYKWCKGSFATMTKYCTSSSSGTVDNKTVLEVADDAATINWGGAWRMPTYAEIQELYRECTWTFITQNGVSGYKVTSKSNGYSIFLPLAGRFFESSLKDLGSVGGYWSSSLDSDDSKAIGMHLYSTANVITSHFRCNGLPVRPVCP